jgi:hypothetical protein
MPHIHRPLAVGFLALLLTGCFGSTATPSASAPSTAAVTPSTDGTASAAATASAEGSAEPIPSEDLGEFSCDLPVHADAPVARANIVDVRVGTHADYDRVVFEFTDGVPEISLDRAEPPFSEDGSGRPIEVDGSSFLSLTMRGGTKQTDDGTSSYDGPTEFTPDFPSLVHLVEAGDFEAQSTWILGLSSEACVRVLTLTDDGAPRLVIDVEH